MKALLIAALAAASAAAQVPDWSRAQPIAIAMTDHGFVPRSVVLRRNQPYVLHVVNRSDKGHNLTQKSFFRFARVAPADRIWTRDGQISLDPRARATVRLLAPATRRGGTYQFSSTTLGDAGSDYKGVITIR